MTETSKEKSKNKTAAAKVKKNAAPSKDKEIQKIIRIGGIHWDPRLVFWGSLGRNKSDGTSTKGMYGYHTRKEGVGKHTDEDRELRTVDVWKCEAVYALFHEGRSIYIGEGILGDRLKMHWKDPHDPLVGRWDSFTWISPWEYIEGDGKVQVEVKAPEQVEHSVRTKKLIELLELVAIRLGSPDANNQKPTDTEGIKWLRQVPSPGAEGGLEKKMDKMLAALNTLQLAFGKYASKEKKPAAKKRSSAGGKAPAGKRASGK